MSSIPSGAKRAIFGSVVVAALPWAVLVSLIFSLFANVFVGMVVGAITGLVVVLAFPERRIAERVYKTLAQSDNDASFGRLRNIADALAIAIGVPPAQVTIIESNMPNVFALPTKSHGLVVIATQGVLRLLDRSELESLVASQMTVAQDKWVRLASRAQLAQAFWGIAIVLSFVFSFGNPFGSLFAFAIVFLFGFTGLGRQADAVRDLVADGVAINTTSNPQALVRALRALRPAVLMSERRKFGTPGMVTDAFAVVSVRLRSTSSVSVNGQVRRTWSTDDELATELGFRAERMNRVANGDLTALQSLGPFRKAWKQLGDDDNPYRLTDAERAAAEAAKNRPIEPN